MRRSIRTRIKSPSSMTIRGALLLLSTGLPNRESEGCPIKAKRSGIFLIPSARLLGALGRPTGSSFNQEEQALKNGLLSTVLRHPLIRGFQVLVMAGFGVHFQV